jgi:DNA-binding winged helix-turn-helix (wHTH) protein
MRLVWSEYELDEERFELRRGGAKVPVQPKVLELLLTLVRARDRVVLRRELFDAIWPGLTVSEASLSRAILEARRAIGDDLQQALVTVRGRGFRFVLDVIERPAEAASTGHEVSPSDPSFVGRASCMTCLESRLDDALSGKGGVVWISGEAGIGKTRAVDELARRARVRGVEVHSVSAHETPAAPQFWLWAQVLRAHAAAHPGPRVTELEAAVGPLLAGDDAVSGAARFKLFDTFTRAFVEASRTAPLVIALDDVHWADDGSRELLQFFAREVRHAAILIVATYRDTEPSDDARGRAFGALLGDCAGLTVPLRGFPPEDIGRFVEVTSGVVPTASFVRALFDRTGGNPLYLRQVLASEWAERALTETAHEVASSMDLQQGLVESIRRHVQSVSAEGRDLLTLAAVLGRDFKFAELALVSGQDHDALLDRLDEAARARVLLKSKAGAHSFTHALVHDVLYKSLSSAERAAKHAQIAARLYAHYASSLDVHSADLAHHYMRALPGGDAERAVDLSVRAAAVASSKDAHGVAARHWRDATVALAHLTADDPRHVDARLGLARAHTLSGDVEGARAAFVDAAMFSRTFGRAESLVDAAVGYASLPGPNPATLQTLLQEAREALARLPASAASAASARLDPFLTPRRAS